MIVLDACAAVEIVRETVRGSAFRALMLEGEEVISSDLFQAEVRNAFWKYVHAGLLDEGLASRYVEQALALVDEFCPLEEYGDEAFLEAALRDHPVYDMLYLCAARRHGATLFTADRGLVRMCEEAGVNCICEVEF